MALLEFRSPAAGGFFMMPETFRLVCEVLGREYAESGCWLPEDIPPVLNTLKEEVAREKVLLAEREKRRRERELVGRFLSFEEEEEAKEEAKEREKVSFGMRVFPLIEMLEVSVKKGKKVMWGVP